MNILKKIKWWQWVGIFLLLLVVLVVVKHLLAVACWEAYARELRKQGVVMEFSELKFSRPEGEDGLPELIQLTKKLSSAELAMPSTLCMTAPGVAVAGWQLPEDYDAKGKPLSTNLWGNFRLAALAEQATLARMQTELEKPMFYADFRYEDGVQMRFPGLMETKKTIQWFNGLSLLKIHHGRQEEALEHAIHAVMLPEKMRGQRMLVCQLVRVACLQINANATWSLLQTNGWNPTQLARWQKHWENTDVLAEWDEIWAVEQLFAREGIKRLRADYHASESYLSSVYGSKDRWDEFTTLLSDATTNPKQAAKDIYGRYPAYWAWVGWDSYDDLIFLQKNFQEIGQVARTFQSSRVFATVAPALDKIRIREEDWKKTAGYGFNEQVVEIAVSRHFERLVKAMVSKQMAIAAIALERYRMQHGAYPESLEALVPAFVVRPLLDPMDGKPLRYKKLPEGGFLMYSIGTDLRDDGGDILAPEAGDTNLLPAFGRRDIVWPRAATAAEAEAWRKGRK